MRYADQKLELDFDSYIGCMVRLEGMFSKEAFCCLLYSFRILDSTNYHLASIALSLSQYLLTQQTQYSSLDYLDYLVCEIQHMVMQCVQLHILKGYSIK